MSYHHWGEGGKPIKRRKGLAFRANFLVEGKDGVTRIKRTVRNTFTHSRGEARSILRGWLADRDRWVLAQSGVEPAPTWKPPPKKLDPTWSQMRDHYLKWKASATEGRVTRFNGQSNLNAFFADDPLWSTIDVSDIDRYQKQRRAAGAAKSTVRNELRMLGAIQRHCLVMGLLHKTYTTPWSADKLLGEIPSNSYRPWTALEYETFRAHLPEWCRRVVDFGWLTGFRRDQIQSLDWGTHVDLDRKILRPIRQKRGKQIEFPYTIIPVLEELIEEQRVWAEAEGYPTTHGAVFRRPSACRGREHRRRRMDRLMDWRREWGEAMKAAAEELPEFGRDLPGFKSGLYFHGLRSNLVTRLLRLGVQPVLITRLTGHKSLVMIDSYNNPDDEQFAEAMAKLNAAERERRDRRHLKVV